jgi:flagellar biosynthesis protein FliR
MTLTVELGWILTVALGAIRLGAALVLTPIFGTANMPAPFRVLFVVGMSAVLVSALPIDAASLPVTVPALVVASLSELVLGALMAFGIFTAFAVFLLAGRIMDIQMGFGVATIIDPSNRTQSPLIGTFLNMLAIALFFAIDGHHLILRGLAFSLERVPPGTFVTSVDPAIVIAQFGGMFVYAVALAAPVLFVILLLDVVLAVMARSMPQMNVFIVSLPLKILVGLITLAISLNYIGPLVARIFEDLFLYWQQLLP